MQPRQFNASTHVDERDEHAHSAVLAPALASIKAGSQECCEWVFPVPELVMKHACC